MTADVIRLADGVVVDVVPPRRSLKVVRPADRVILVAPLVGPRGPTGATGGNPVELVVVDPVTEWVFNHNLGRYPDVAVYVANQLVNAVEVTHVGLNQAVIRFAAPQAGRARAT